MQLKSEKSILENIQPQGNLIHLPVEHLHRLNKQNKYIFIKVDYCTIKIILNEIRFVEGLKDYIKIFINEKFYITKSTIKHIESKLPIEQFARVHKSYIISIDKIDKIEYNHIFIGQNKIPIGMQFKDSFYEKIDSLRL